MQVRLWSQHVTFIQVGPTERLVVRKEHTASVRAFTTLHFCPHAGVHRVDEPASETEPCLTPCPQGLPTDPAILDRVRALLRQWNATTVMVSEDSSHAYHHVRCCSRGRATEAARVLQFLTAGAAVSHCLAAGISHATMPHWCCRWL